MSSIKNQQDFIEMLRKNTSIGKRNQKTNSKFDSLRGKSYLLSGKQMT